MVELGLKFRQLAPKTALSLSLPPLGLCADDIALFTSNTWQFIKSLENL